MAFASFDNHPKIKTSLPGVARAGLYEVPFCWTGDIGIIKNGDICRILFFVPACVPPIGFCDILYEALDLMTSYCKAKSQL